jgi:hypothetical protein
MALVGCGSVSKEDIEIEKVEIENKTENEVRERPLQKEFYNGQVAKVIGNIVTIDVYEAPEKKELTEEQKEKMKTLVSRNTNMGNSKGMFKMGAGMKRGNESEVKLTGEQLDIIIPVGLEINKRGREGNTSVELDEIAKGIKLRIVIDEELSDEENKFAESVYVMGAGGA